MHSESILTNKHVYKGKDKTMCVFAVVFTVKQIPMARCKDKKKIC